MHLEIKIGIQKLKKFQVRKHTRKNKMLKKEVRFKANNLNNNIEVKPG